MLISRAVDNGDYNNLATTLRSVGDAVLTTDLDGKITFLNSMAELLTGFCGTKAQGLPVEMVLRLKEESTGQPIKSPVQRVLEENESTGYLNHTVVTSQDGVERVVSYAATPLRVSSGATVGVVVVFHRALSQDDLKKTEERFQLIARATNDAVWDVDLSTGRMWFGEGVTTLFGYGPDDVESNREWWLRNVHPEDRSRVEQTYADAQQNLRYWQQEYRFRNKHGGYSAVLERGYVLRDLVDKAHRMVAAVMDITGRREAQEELIRLNTELEREVQARTMELREANKELEAFSYSVSHDLRSPLRSILVNSHLLETEHADHLDEESKLILGRLTGSAKRMAELIEDMLQYSRVSRSKLQLQEVDITKLVETVIEEYSGDYGRGEFVVQQNMVEQADPSLLRVLFDNLIDNACKYSSKAENPRIEIGCEQQREETVYFVRDNGVGFEPSEAHRLFKPFERLHLDSDFVGTGIGLTNVQRIVTRHGGRIWAVGEPGEGATFYFTLG